MKNGHKMPFCLFISCYNMLSNVDLQNLAIHYHIDLVDICMKDEMPEKVVDGNYIINLENSEDPDGSYNSGTHWLGLKIQGKKACYFDSFGAPPPKEICDYVKKRKGSRLAFNNWDIQDLRSENCGYFSLSFLIYMENDLKTDIFAKFNDYVNIYEDDTIQNDALLKNFFRQLRDTQMPQKIKRLLNEKTIKI